MTMENSVLQHRMQVAQNIEKSCTEGIEIQKARSGVYSDNAMNRKLNRVGQQYGGKKQPEQASGGNGKKVDEPNHAEHAKNASTEALKRAAADENADEKVRNAAKEELKNRGDGGEEKDSKDKGGNKSGDYYKERLKKDNTLYDFFQENKEHFEGNTDFIDEVDDNTFEASIWDRKNGVYHIVNSKLNTTEKLIFKFSGSKIKSITLFRIGGFGMPDTEKDVTNEFVLNDDKGGKNKSDKPQQQNGNSDEELESSIKSLPPKQRKEVVAKMIDAKIDEFMDSNDKDAHNDSHKYRELAFSLYDKYKDFGVFKNPHQFDQLCSSHMDGYQHVAFEAYLEARSKGNDENKSEDYANTYRKELFDGLKEGYGYKLSEQLAKSAAKSKLK